MPTFTYRAVDKSGKNVTGEIDAADRKGVIRSLNANGLTPMAIETRMDAAAAAQDALGSSHDFFSTKSTETETAGKKKKLFKMAKSKNAIALGFLQNLLMLIQSGLSLGDSLRLLHNRVGDVQQKELSGSLWKKISEGRTLSASMAEFPQYFKESHCQLVAAGEASGKLPAVMERIVAYLEETSELKKKLVAGMAYPMFIVVFALIIVVFFLTFLLPRVRTMIETMGGEMQLFARVLIWAAEITVYAGPFIVGGLFIATVAIINWRKTTKGRLATDGWLLRLPVFGPLYLHTHVLQTTSLLSTLLDSGVNTPEALKLVERTVPNMILRARYTAIRRMIQEGASLSNSIRKMRIMPDIDVDILAVGENTGNISSSLKRIYEIHRSEMTRSMGLVTVVLSSGALFIAFAMVAMIAMSIVMSVLDISHSMMLRH
jgi:type II secretory pathway component PulF